MRLMCGFGFPYNVSTVLFIYFISIEEVKCFVVDAQLFYMRKITKQSFEKKNSGNVLWNFIFMKLKFAYICCCLFTINLGM